MIERIRKPGPDNDCRSVPRMPLERIGGSKKNQFGPLKRGSHMGGGSVDSGKKSCFPDNCGAQQKVDLACQVEDPRFVRQK